MQLIESYLVEVGRYLPAATRSDILSELRVSLEDQAQELAGDSAPTQDHERAVIERLGHPLKVASAYRSPQYLIGPALFPTFLETLKTVLILFALIQVSLLLTAYVTTGSALSPLGLTKNLLGTGALAALVVIAVFAGLEYSGERVDPYDDWSAASLKPRGGTPVDQSRLISDLVTEGIFLLWWNDVLRLRDWLPAGDGDTLTLRLTEVWSALYWPLNLLAGAWFLLHAWVLFRGLWQRATIACELALGAASVALCGWLLSQRPLVTLNGLTTGDNAVAADRVIVTVLIVVIGVTVWEAWVTLGQVRTARAAPAVE